MKAVWKIDLKLTLFKQDALHLIMGVETNSSSEGTLLKPSLEKVLQEAFAMSSQQNTEGMYQMLRGKYQQEMDMLMRSCDNHKERALTMMAQLYYENAESCEVTFTFTRHHGSASDIMSEYTRQTVSA